MPTIYDNITLHLLSDLKQAIQVAYRVERASQAAHRLAMSILKMRD